MLQKLQSIAIHTIIKHNNELYRVVAKDSIAGKTFKFIDKNTEVEIIATPEDLAIQFIKKNTK